MATVPRLNYTNIRNKSKSKESDQPEQKTEGNKSDLFSHMNQDNLKYIQNQIKQKNKKNNVMARKEEPPPQLEPYPEQIEEKESRFEETEREINNESNEKTEQNLMEEKTEGNEKGIDKFEVFSAMRKKNSQQPEQYKLTFYDLVSQAKSKRVSSIQGALEDDHSNHKQQDSFLNFLEAYIQDLNINRKEKNSKNKRILESKENKKTVNGEQEMFRRIIEEQKRKNVILAKEIERHNSREFQNRRRIQSLEGVVALISEEMEILKRQFRSDREVYKQDFRPMNMTMDLRGDRSRVSRNSHLPYKAHEGKESRINRKNKHSTEEIYQLERELKVFEETGEFI